MKKQRRFFLCLLCLTVFSMAVLAGCGNGTVENPPLPSQTLAETPAPVETQAPVETEPPASAFLAAGSREEIKEGLIEAVGQFRPELVVDFSGAGLENPEMDVRNLYYEMNAQQPALKYVYDLEIQVDGSQLVCTFHYMPYKTGDFPEGFAGQEAGSIPELIALAEENIGQEAVPVRITNRELDPDSMNRALQQAGGGYLLCMLNRDATAIQYQASFGTDMETGLAALAEADQLAEQVIAQVVTPGMSQWEKAEALYAYVTSTVSYDQRYYTDRNKMPYDSQTALGALRDGVAICGGYSHAVKLLFEKVGIPCFNVAGKYFSENHMWNIALLDGQWLWFDATADRGSTGEFGFLRFGLTELDSTKYSWDQEQLQWLIG
ncbi:MAG: transglutaminase domain-containing protein [bacterium]|nr:transglutaminase domain-containing protein [bacterium]